MIQFMRERKGYTLDMVTFKIASLLNILQFDFMSFLILSTFIKTKFKNCNKKNHICLTF